MTRAVVGIDPSLTATGVAHQPAPHGPVSLDTLTTKPAESLPGKITRLDRISSAIADLVPWGALVVIEGPGLSRGSQKGHHLLAGLWWQIVTTLNLTAGCEFVEVSPSALKKFATGAGTASKSDMRMAMFKRAGLDVADDNQVDAWWLRQIGLHLVGDQSAVVLPKDQLAVVAALRGQLPA